MTHRRLFARRRPERGAAAVEFALVLPVLFLIIGAIIDFGFVFAQQIAFNTSVRDAARAGVLPSLAGTRQTCGQVAARARVGAANGAIGASAQRIGVSVTGAGGTCTLAAGSASPSGASGAFPCTGSATKSPTDLQVTLTYASSPPFPVPFMGPVNLGSKGNFQCEYT